MASADEVGGWVKKGQNLDDVLLEWSARGQFGPLHICVGESPKCCIAVVVFEPHNLLSAVRLSSSHSRTKQKSNYSRMNLFVCLFGLIQ